MVIVIYNREKIVYVAVVYASVNLQGACLRTRARVCLSKGEDLVIK